MACVAGIWGVYFSTAQLSNKQKTIGTKKVMSGKIMDNETSKEARGGECSEKPEKSDSGTMSISEAVGLALEHHQAGNLSQAEELYRQVLAADPDNPNANHLLGVIAHEEGQHDIAVLLIQKAIQSDPNFAEAYYNLGNALKESGRLDEAIAVYRKAIELNPDIAEVHNNLGSALQKKGLLDEAIAGYGKAVSIKPDFAEAHYNLGIALQETGPLDEAIASYRKALSIRPDYAKAHNNLGNALQEADLLDEAIASYGKALSIKPDFAEAFCNFGNVLKKTGQLDEAIGNYRKALSIKPDFANAHYNLGHALKETGRLDEAISNYRKAVSIKPNYAEVYNDLAIALQATGRLDEAIASCRKAVSIKPDYAEAHNNLGNVLQESGLLDEGIANYRKAVSIKPDYADAHRHLSFTVKHTDYDNDIAIMEVLYARKDITDEQRMHLGFAIGKAFEDLKEYDKSFGFTAEANRLKRATFEYSISEDQDFIGRIKEVFTLDFFSGHRGLGNPDEAPIFILGMPRSGTTLVEQILASHPLVFGAGELNHLSNLTRDLCAKRTTGEFPECVRDMDKDVFKKVGSDYVDRIRRHSKEAKYITDKMPHHFLYVGLIKAILPNAKVIHCMRNPMDNCLSIFKNYFSGAGAHKYAYDMSELGRYYNLYLELMEHWRSTLPDFMFEIRYEELVSNQERETRRLLEFCGLPWEEACLSFHKTKRKVATGSSSQVRRPMYKDSVQLWKRYERQLEPLGKAIYG